MGDALLNYDKNNLFEKEESRVVQKKFIKYVPAQFVMCPLPLRSLGSEVKQYERKYNNLKLKITGVNGIPSGKIARNMLMLFTTEVVYKKDSINCNIVNLYFNSLNNLVKSIGVKGSDYNNKVSNILDQFSGCSISFEINIKEKINTEKDYLFFNDKVKKENEYNYMNFKSFINVPIIYKVKRIDLINEKRGRTDPIEIDIQLADKFVEMVKDNAIPIDSNVYNDMQSALMSDLYVWLIYRNNKIMKDDGLFISRKNLIDQFGEENLNTEREKYRRIINAIIDIKKYYYEKLNFRVIGNGSNKNKGIILYKSPLVISESNTKYVPIIKV
jgi:hypothetical protein